MKQAKLLIRQGPWDQEGEIHDLEWVKNALSAARILFEVEGREADSYDAFLRLTEQAKRGDEEPVEVTIKSIIPFVGG